MTDAERAGIVTELLPDTKIRLLTMDGDEIRVAEVVHARRLGGDRYAIDNDPVSRCFSAFEEVEAPVSDGIPTCRRDVADWRGGGEPAALGGDWRVQARKDLVKAMTNVVKDENRPVGERTDAGWLLAKVIADAEARAGLKPA